MLSCTSSASSKRYTTFAVSVPRPVNSTTVSVGSSAFSPTRFSNAGPSGCRPSASGVQPAISRSLSCGQTSRRRGGAGRSPAGRCRRLAAGCGSALRAAARGPGRGPRGGRWSHPRRLCRPDVVPMGGWRRIRASSSPAGRLAWVVHVVFLVVRRGPLCQVRPIVGWKCGCVSSTNQRHVSQSAFGRATQHRSRA